MKRATWFFVTVISLFFLSSAIFLFAQTDESPPPPRQTPTPLPPPQVKIDWANITLSEHDDFPSEMQVFANPSNQSPQSEVGTEVPSINASSIVEPPYAETEFSTYIVAPGDTIYKISRQLNVPVQTIISLNLLGNPNLIHTGLVLKIPADPTAPNPPPESVPENGRLYTVRAGDSLYSIARAFGTAISVIIQANQINNPALIFPGSVLTIPGENAQPIPQPPPLQPPAPEPAPPVNEGNTYLVKAGDSLNSIARQLGVSVEALAYINNINNWAVIYPGQLLTIPSPEYVPPPPTQLPPSSSGFIWPVNSRAIVQGYHGAHQAIDIALPSGSPVVAIASGTIEFAGWNNHGYGNLIVVNHGNGVRSLYAHNSAFLVVQGQQVNQGESIASSGNTGHSTMPHLHLEIMFDTFNLVNPCDHLPGGC